MHVFIAANTVDRSYLHVKFAAVSIAYLHLPTFPQGYVKHTYTTLCGLSLQSLHWVGVWTLSTFSWSSTAAVGWKSNSASALWTGIASSTNCVHVQPSWDWIYTPTGRSRAPHRPQRSESDHWHTIYMVFIGCMQYPFCSKCTLRHLSLQC